MITSLTHWIFSCAGRVGLLSILLSATACSYLPSKTPSAVDSDEQQTLHYAANASTIDDANTPHDYAPIPADTLYALLVAEMAGQRQHYDVAVVNYLKQAQRTRQPDIAERATRIAQFVGIKPIAKDALSIWLDSAPSNPAAHQAAVQIYMEDGDYQNAFSHAETLQNLTGNSVYDFLAANAVALSAEKKQALLDLLLKKRQQQPKNSSLWLATGLLQQQLNHYEAALKDINKALKLDPEQLSAGLQKARLLVLLKRPDEALSWLDKLDHTYPQQKGIMALRARILLEQKRLDEARLAFSELQQQFPDDAAVLLTLALLNDETGHSEEAKENFYQLIMLQEFTNEAHFYLGRMADREGDDNTAIEQYRQVQGGKEFLNAHLRATFLVFESQGLKAAQSYLHEQKQAYPESQLDFTRIEIELLINAEHFKPAMSLLNDTLKTQPDHIDLLYSRAMLAERMQNLPLLEQDLRHILSLDANNINALNALGYTLADRTDRFAEAKTLLDKAYQLAPTNPAIIDSLGWLYFKQGQLEKAKPLLEQAFNLFQDHEIAAHLGELLWQEGQHDQAIKVWQQGYRHMPDSPIINATLKRLNIDRQQWPTAQHD